MPDNESSDLKQNLSAHLDGELDPAKVDALEQALAGHPDLKRDLDAWRLTCGSD